jgi:SOS response regulatory protein OraA/RecX
MDPIITSVVTGVMTVLLPYVTKGAEEFAKAAGKDGYEKAKNLLGALKKRWSKDKEATDQLANFEKKPERYQPVLEDILAEKLSQDKEFADELAQILKEMGPTLEVIQKMKEAENVVGLEAKEMVGGKAKVDQEIEKAKNVTGSKIDRIG